MVLLASVALTFGTMGCGDDDDGGGSKTSNNGGGGGGGGDGSTETASCCLNGQFFDCGTASAAQACFDNFEPGTCVADSSRNNECNTGGGGNGGGDNGGGDNGGQTGGSTGDQCQFNSDCASNSCLTDGGAFGYCTTTCNSWSDCPSFWECENVSNASSKYCIQD